MVYEIIVARTKVVDLIQRIKIQKEKRPFYAEVKSSVCSIDIIVHVCMNVDNILALIGENFPSCSPCVSTIVVLW